jgi:hypothetical protein
MKGRKMLPIEYHYAKFVGKIDEIQGANEESN